jgi:hypothetical protein
MEGLAVHSFNKLVWSLTYLVEGPHFQFQTLAQPSF